MSEKYFTIKLTDYDPSVNNETGNDCSTRTDPKPYFQNYLILLLSEKFVRIYQKMDSNLKNIHQRYP